MVVGCERDEDKRVVVVCERLVLDCCPPDVSDAVLLVLVALVGFDDDEVDDEVDDDEMRGGKGDSDEVDGEAELGWLGVFGSSLSPPLELDGDGVFALEPGVAGGLAGWLALVDACRSMGGLGLCAGVADADCGNAAVCGCTAGAALVGVRANEEVALRGDSTAMRACGTGAGLVGVGVSEVGKVGIGAAFGRQVSTAGLDEAGTVAPGLGGDGIKGLGEGEL